ncbi:MAG: hypothetical protein C0599_12235 [Salinivirgaceae bacterium]|nr:MAG: hypothetical protein C0599_12235 [Salinivirgaceae bacterium]
MLTAMSTFTRLKRISLTAGIIFLMVSCDLFYNEGEWKTEIRDTEPFRNIIIENVIEVYYHYCDTFAIEVQHYDKQLSDIKTEVKDQSLTLKNTFSGQAYTDIRTPQVHLYAPMIYQVDINKETGAGFFCKDTIYNSRFQINIAADLAEAIFLVNTDTLQMNISKTAGVIQMEGSAQKFLLQNTGEVPIKGKKLNIQQLNIIHQSSQNVELTVSEYIKYKILRSGNIIIWGSPENTGENLGTGKIIFK